MAGELLISSRNLVHCEIVLFPRKVGSVNCKWVDGRNVSWGVRFVFPNFRVRFGLGN